MYQFSGGTFYFLSLTVLFGAIQHAAPLHLNHPIVLIISMDGFSNDYVEDCLTPTLKRLRENGVYAQYMKNVFPTKTFPNHHSIATGLYPEVHGVLDSSVYDSKDDCTNRSLIEYSYELYHYDNDILPIWTLNQLAAKDRHSGVLMWPGGEFPYGCKKTVPTFSQAKNFSISFQQRVDMAVSWITHPKTPANLVMVYFEEPDLHGHAFGVKSDEVRDKIKALDLTLLYLEQQLKANNLEHMVDVFVVSDHGMINLDQKNIINLDKYVDNSTYIAATKSPVLQIFPKEGKEELVSLGLQEAQSRHKKAFDVYLKNEIPYSWHIRNNNRTAPILIVAKEGYAFQDFYVTMAEFNTKFNIETNPRNKYGMHGYSNDYRSMNSLFFAWGPSLKSGVVIDPFNTIDLYPTWAEVLGLELEEHEYSSPVVQMFKNHSQISQGIAGTVELQKSSPSHAGPVGAGVWAYWLGGILTVVLLFAIAGVIYSYFRGGNDQTNGLKRSSYSRVEAQQLLVSDSEGDGRS